LLEWSHNVANNVVKFFNFFKSQYFNAGPTRGVTRCTSYPGVGRSNGGDLKLTKVALFTMFLYNSGNNTGDAKTVCRTFFVTAL